MILRDVNIPILINRVENHSDIKPTLLKLIDEMPSRKLISGEVVNNTITKTDLKIPKCVERQYWNFIRPIIEKTTIRSLIDHFKCKNIELDNYWFQQYYRSDYHGWHTHSHTHWTNVYFVELPNEHLKTQIMDIRRESLIDYHAMEGDIITFPSMLYHRSPRNDLDERKTIISFNLNDCSCEN